jgi:hypothetical protein
MKNAINCKYALIKLDCYK